MAARLSSLGALLLLALAPSTLARTDLSGCTTKESMATRVWYVPGTGEVCEPLDCGGGRAPPKTTVPGCPMYSGTETYSPSFIDIKTLGDMAATPAAAMVPAEATAAAAGAGTTVAPNMAGIAYKTGGVRGMLMGGNSTGGNSTVLAAAPSLSRAGAVWGASLVAGVAAGMALL